MKKLLFVLAILSGISLIISDYSFGQFNPKKIACEKSCNEAFDKCVNKCMDDAAKIKDAKKKKDEQDSCKVKKDAIKIGCQKAKDDCNKKCN